MRNFEIEAGGMRWAGLEAGTGPVVLLLHGFPETARVWRHQLADLAAAGFRAMAPDLPGYGASAAPAEVAAYRVDRLVAGLVSLLDALGIAQAVVVGSDWGATLAWAAAELRPDRFRAVAAIGVPAMGRPPVPPSRIFPQDATALFYTLYFQTPGVAEAEFEADVALTLRRILHAASAEAGPRQPGDGTPNPFSMVSRRDGLLAGLPEAGVPGWLTAEEFDAWVAAFRVSGFRGGLNWYRNLDANWEVMPAGPIRVPAFFMVGAQDPGLAMPGMREIIAAMPKRAPDLRGSLILEHCGHWASQEQPDAVSAALTGFLHGLS